jgi:hypothetical protein
VIPDIAAWLLKQYDHDQKDAEQARESSAMEWPPDDDEPDEPERFDSYMVGLDAKRRIVELHSRGHECSVYDRHGEVDSCCYVHDFEACSTLRLLALPYRDRPGFDPEWLDGVRAQ